MLDRAVHATGPGLVSEMRARYEQSVGKDCSARDKTCQVYLADWREFQPVYDEHDLRQRVVNRCVPFLSNRERQYPKGSMNYMKKSLCLELHSTNYKSKIYKNSVSYHDFLHLAYNSQKKAFKRIDVSKLVPKVTFYTDQAKL